MPSQAGVPKTGLERLRSISGREHFDVNFYKWLFLVWERRTGRGLSMWKLTRKDFLRKIFALDKFGHWNREHQGTAGRERKLVSCFIFGLSVGLTRECSVLSGWREGRPRVFGERWGMALRKEGHGLRLKESKWWFFIFLPKPSHPAVSSCCSSTHHSPRNPRCKHGDTSSSSHFLAIHCCQWSNHVILPRNASSICPS